MWLLDFIPDSIIHLTLIVGILIVGGSLFISMFPVVDKYRLPIQLLGTLIVVLCVYLEGGISNDMIWKEKASKLEVENARLETEIAKQDIKTVEKIVTQTKVIRERGEEVIRYVDREVVKYDTKFIKGGECELPKEFFDSYNKSMELPTK